MGSDDKRTIITQSARRLGGRMIGVRGSDLVAAASGLNLSDRGKEILNAAQKRGQKILSVKASEVVAMLSVSPIGGSDVDDVQGS